MTSFSLELITAVQTASDPRWPDLHSWLGRGLPVWDRSTLVATAEALAPWMLDADGWQGAALIALASGCQTQRSEPVRQALLARALGWLEAPTTDLQSDTPWETPRNAPTDPFGSYLGAPEPFAAGHEGSTRNPRQADAIAILGALLDAAAAERGDPVAWWVSLEVALRQRPEMLGQILAAASERTRRRIATWVSETGGTSTLLQQESLNAAEAAQLLGYRHARSVYDLRTVWPDIFLPKQGRSVRIDRQRLLARLASGRPPSPSRRRRAADAPATTAAGRRRGAQPRG